MKMAENLTQQPGWLICAILSTPEPMDAVQDFIKCVEAIGMIYIRHAVIVSVGTVPQSMSIAGAPGRETEQKVEMHQSD